MGGAAGQSCWLLITLYLRGILAGDWSVHLPSGPICAVIGSSVVLPCSYDYPLSSNVTKEVGRLSAQGGDVLSEMWCLEESRCVTPSYVFHSAGIFQDPSYQNRVEYLGQPGTKNCSLKISDLRQSDSGAYVFYLITSHPTQKMPEQRGVQLLVAESSRAVAVSASPPSHMAEGGALHLACCSPGTDPQARFTWYKSTSTSPRHTGQVWSISEATSDESGSYYCQKQIGDTVQNSTMLPIDVEYSPRNTAVTVTPAVEQQNGLPLTLTCSSDANPPVHTYSWYQGPACLPTADKSFYRAKQSVATPAGGSPTLSRTDITNEEYGLHCCVARNTHGSQTVSLTATPPSNFTGARLVLIAVSIGILLAIMVIVAFLVKRRQQSSSRQSYVLTETTAIAP